jgi:hypothetical protein
MATKEDASAKKAEDKMVPEPPAKKAEVDSAAAARGADAEQCAQTFHAWELPAHNPFNGPDLSCSFTCKRCKVSAKLTIVVG